MKELESNIPQNINQWLDEISRAFLDAKDAIPFGKYVGEKITEDQLFHFAPRVAIKFRGIKPSKKNIKQATEAALSTYVANSDREDIQMKNKYLVFSLCYLASHLGLGILTENSIDKIMTKIEDKINLLENLITTKSHNNRLKAD